MQKNGKKFRKKKNVNLMIRIKERFFEFLFFSNIVLVMNEYLHIRTHTKVDRANPT